MDERAIFTRTHRLAKSKSEHVDVLTRSYPVTQTQVTQLFGEAEDGATLSVDGEPPHVVAHHNEWDYEVSGWNRTYAYATLVEGYLKEHHPMPEASTPDDIHEAVSQAFGSYHPPRWEQQTLGQGDGGYTRAFILTHLTQMNEVLPAEWYGLTDQEELVYIRYRGGTLRMYISNGVRYDPTEDLAYLKQVAPFPDCDLSTETLLVEEWPDWASYTDPLEPLPDEWHERISQEMRETMTEVPDDFEE